MPTAPTDNKTLTLQLDKARWWSLREQPFYGQIAMGLVDVIDDKTPTACTNGKKIRWGRTFLAGLTDEETRFVLLHEALHCAHGDLWRLPPDLQGNQAADYANNHVLSKIEGISMPKDGLVCPPQWYDLAPEEIYPLLPKPKDDGKGGKSGKGKQDKDGQPGDGEPDDQGTPTGDFEAPAEDEPKEGKEGQPSDGSTLREDWERRVIQADQFAKATGRGDLPADLQRVLERVRHQPICWKSETADFVKNSITTRNDWTRSARRHATAPVIYPRRRADDLGLVIFAIDTSGSIGADVIAEFVALVGSCLADTGCRGLALYCDAAIHAEHWLSPGEECPLTTGGGGGTSHRPIFARADELAEQGERIAGIVCLTDCQTDFPEPSDIPSLWLSTSSSLAPFGRNVRIEAQHG